MVTKQDNLIVFKEKHSDRHFQFQNKEELQKIFFLIFKERLEENYYPNVFIDWLKEMLDNKDYQKIEQLIYDRKDYEYEGFYSYKIEEFEKWK